jgi:hypothetical protein
MSEYLVSHGKSGAFGRFAPEQPLECCRGDVVVVRSTRGLEMGKVLCPVSERQQRLLGHTPLGRLLRPATPEDELGAEQKRALSLDLFAEVRRLAVQLSLPVAILDAEVLLDGQRAVVQCLVPPECDVEPLAVRIEERFRLTLFLENLSVNLSIPEEEHGGCGQPGCGHASGGGGCSSCGSGGGCSSCGGKVDMRDYFAHLRTRMEEQQQRTSLL